MLANSRTQAIARIEELESDGLPADLMNLKGVCLMRTANPEAAIVMFDKALAADPSNTEAVANKKSANMLSASLKADAANAHFRSNDHASALSAYMSIDLSTASPECAFQVNNKVESEEDLALQAEFANIAVDVDEPEEAAVRYRSKTTDAAELEDAAFGVGEDAGECFVQMDFDLEELTYPGPYPKGIRVDKREQYLPDQLFQEMFKMTKHEFYELRKWRQIAKKKEVGLW